MVVHILLLHILDYANWWQPPDEVIVIPAKPKKETDTLKTTKPAAETEKVHQLLCVTSTLISTRCQQFISSSLAWLNINTSIQ